MLHAAANAPAADWGPTDQPLAGGDAAAHPVQTDSPETGKQDTTATAAPRVQAMPGMGQFPFLPPFPPGFMMPFPPFPFAMQNGM